MSEQNKKIAVIGDVHGCLGELRDLVAKLRKRGITRIYHLGDLIDRGPDSKGVVRYCLDEGIQGVVGNHEGAFLDLYNKTQQPGFDWKILEAAKGGGWGGLVKELDAEEIAYLKSLPRYLELPSHNTILVHAGMRMGIPLEKQGISVCHMQVIHPYKPEIRWLAKKNKYTLEQSRAEGFFRWQEGYDREETVVYGHSVYPEAHVEGNTIGIDTGCVHGGTLTAVVLPGREFVTVRARKVYYQSKRKTGE